MITAKGVVRLIDISAVQTHNTLRDIQSLVDAAKKYRFINVHTLPC